MKKLQDEIAMPWSWGIFARFTYLKKYRFRTQERCVEISVHQVYQGGITVVKDLEFHPRLNFTFNTIQRVLLILDTCFKVCLQDRLIVYVQPVNLSTAISILWHLSASINELFWGEILRDLLQLKIQHAFLKLWLYLYRRSSSCWKIRFLWKSILEIISPYKPIVPLLTLMWTPVEVCGTARAPPSPAQCLSPAGWTVCGRADSPGTSQGRHTAHAGWSHSHRECRASCDNKVWNRPWLDCSDKRFAKNFIWPNMVLNPVAVY